MSLSIEAPHYFKLFTRSLQICLHMCQLNCAPGDHRVANDENGPLTTDYGPLTTAGGEGCGIDWNTKSVRRYEGTKVRFKCGMRTFDHGSQDNGPLTTDYGPLTTDHRRVRNRSKCGMRDHTGSGEPRAVSRLRPAARSGAGAARGGGTRKGAF